MLPHDPTGKSGPKKPLPDHVSQENRTKRTVSDLSEACVCSEVASLFVHALQVRPNQVETVLSAVAYSSVPHDD